jgi:hypothetical protein
MENERKITAMGMAAGQARLLSITARMSDNELRAQIINNDKMRLATESSQVSDHYVQALNEAELMFTNYDANNNASFKQLTYNALTSYNPYNNQYCLTNASGNILLSEFDAKNYKNSDTLEEFLKCYGLEQTTTYFENLKTNDDGFVIFTNPEVEDDPATPLNESENQSTGLTPKQLELAFLGVDEYKRIHEKDEGFKEEDLKIDMNGASGVEPKGYDVTLNSAKMNDYVAKLDIYNEAYDKLLEFVREGMNLQIDLLSKLVSGKSLKDFYKDITSTESKDENLGTLIGYLNKFGQMLGEPGGTVTVDSKTLNGITNNEFLPNPITKESTEYIDKIRELVDQNNKSTKEEVFDTDTSLSSTFAIVQNNDGTFIASINKNDDGTWSVANLKYKIDGNTLKHQDSNDNWVELDS